MKSGAESEHMSICSELAAYGAGSLGSCFTLLGVFF